MRDMTEEFNDLLDMQEQAFDVINEKAKDRYPELENQWKLDRDYIQQLENDLTKIETEKDILNEDFWSMKDYLDKVLKDNENLREEVSELNQEKIWLKNLVEKAYWDGFEDYSFLLDRKNPSYDNWENSVTKRELDARYTDE